MLDLPPVSPQSPAGENLENDGAFGALERAGRGKPEQQHGDLVVPAEDPDWKDVEAQAEALLALSHDLRILLLLAIARLHLRGLPAFADVLAAIRLQLQDEWDHVHPQLDPEDDLDPTLRANALLGLADPARVLRVLRDLPLTVSPRAGRISWRDIGVALGTIEAPDDRDRLTETTIRGAFLDADPARIAALREAVASAIADSIAIPAAFDGKSGHGSGPDLSELTKLLRDIGRYLERYAAGEEEATVSETETAEDAGPSAGPALASPRGGATAASLAAVSTRADALRLIELAVQYYERYEPSSPLPLLLGRARRLADKSFLDVLRDLAPDGLDSAQRVVGTGEE